MYKPDSSVMHILQVLLRSGTELPTISGVADVRDAISQLASDVSVERNLLAAEVRMRMLCHLYAYGDGRPSQCIE